MVGPLVSIYFGSPRHRHPVKKKLYEISDCWSIDMFNFDFLKKGMRLASPPHFVDDFIWKMFLIFYSNTSWDIWQYVYCNYLFSSYVTSQTLKFTLVSLSVCFLIWSKNPPVLIRSPRLLNFKEWWSTKFFSVAKWVYSFM